jgi:hypothetical protein
VYAFLSPTTALAALETKLIREFDPPWNRTHKISN